MGREIKYIAICLSFLMLAPFSAETFGARETEKLTRGCSVCFDKSNHQHGGGFSPHRLGHADPGRRISDRRCRGSNSAASRSDNRSTRFARRVDHEPWQSISVCG